VPGTDFAGEVKHGDGRWGLVAVDRVAGFFVHSEPKKGERELALSVLDVLRNGGLVARPWSCLRIADRGQNPAPQLLDRN
jgi:hypothetical protein